MPKLGSLELKGVSGRTYEFAVYPRSDVFKPLGAVYFHAKRIPFAEGEAEYTWIYVGESADISRRPFDPSHKACIDEHEANCICLFMQDDADARAMTVSDLRRAFHPPCNDEPSP
jgi:hypothetical protein